MTQATGALVSELRYSAYGEQRFASGASPTDYRYTGQLSKIATVGLYHYGARWFDPYLNHWLQADSIIPNTNSPIDWDRYAYSRNNPVNNTDSTGHCIDGLTNVPCLMALIAIAGFAGGAANYEFNVSGKSWWESSQDAINTAKAGIDGLILSVGVALTAGQAALLVPDAAMYFGSQSGNTPVYTWGATKNGLFNSVGEPYLIVIDPKTGKPIPPPSAGLSWVPPKHRAYWGPESKKQYMDDFWRQGYVLPQSYEDYQIHHIIPREYGGSSNFDNLTPVLIPEHKEFNRWWANYE